MEVLVCSRKLVVGDDDDAEGVPIVFLVSSLDCLDVLLLLSSSFRDATALEVIGWIFDSLDFLDGESFVFVCGLSFCFLCSL